MGEFFNTDKQAGGFYTTKGEESGETAGVNGDKGKDIKGGKGKEKEEGKGLDENDAVYFSPEATGPEGPPVKIIEFNNQTTGEILAGKENLSMDELEIFEFISKSNHEILEIFLKAFEQMLEHARIKREEAKIHYEKVIRPQKEAMADELAKEDLKKLAIKESDTRA